ncbi:MAG: hypothetical protein WD749_10575 [Phycisphaerales bacterium]
MITPSARALCVCVVGLAGAGAAAQEPTVHERPAPDVLRGPKVVEAPRAPTLVKRDMSGRLERLDTRPEEAAIAMLELTAEQRAAIEEVLVARRAQVSALLEREWDLFIRVQAARQGGAAPSELGGLIRGFRPAAAGLLTPPLGDRVAAALPEAERGEFRRLVAEYNAAATAEGEGDRSRDRGPRAVGNPARAAERVELNLLLREMARALRAVVEERREHMEAFLRAVEATPEQEKTIRDITRAAAEAGRRSVGPGGASDAAAATQKRVMDVLTPEQRAKAAKFRRGGS